MMTIHLTSDNFGESLNFDIFDNPHSTIQTKYTEDPVTDQTRIELIGSDRDLLYYFQKFCDDSARQLGGDGDTYDFWPDAMTMLRAWASQMPEPHTAIRAVQRAWTYTKEVWDQHDQYTDDFHDEVYPYPTLMI